jgi:hypothetical protein
VKMDVAGLKSKDYKERGPRVGTLDFRTEKEETEKYKEKGTVIL